MSPSLVVVWSSCLAVRDRELALKHDEIGDEIEHTASFRRTGRRPGPDVVIGGPSRFKGGMAVAGLSSYDRQTELRKSGKAYTRRGAAPRFVRSSMPDQTVTSSV